MELALTAAQCTAVRDPARKVVSATGSVPSTRPFSPSILAGRRLFVAGMVGRGPDGFATGIEEQTRLALQRAWDTLAAAGSEARPTSWSDVVSVRVFLADIRHYDAMNRVYSEVVGRPAPARATVGTPLASPDALVEIEITAYLPQR